MREMGKVGWRIETVRGLFPEIFADGGDIYIPACEMDRLI